MQQFEKYETGQTHSSSDIHASYTGNGPGNYAATPIDPQQYERQQSYTQGYIPVGPAESYRQSRPVGQIPEGMHYPQQQYIPLLYMFPTNEPSSLSKMLAVFSYLGLWFTGLITLLFVRNDRFARFHAMQSLLFYGVVNILYVVFFAAAVFLRHLFFFRYDYTLPELLLFGAFFVMNVIAGIAWLVGVGSSLSGKYAKMPFVGDIAEGFVGGKGTESVK